MDIEATYCYVAARHYRASCIEAFSINSLRSARSGHVRACQALDYVAEPFCDAGFVQRGAAADSFLQASACDRGRIGKGGLRTLPRSLPGINGTLRLAPYVYPVLQILTDFHLRHFCGCNPPLAQSHLNSSYLLCNTNVLHFGGSNKTENRNRREFVRLISKQRRGAAAHCEIGGPVLPQCRLAVSGLRIVSEIENSGIRRIK